MRALDLMTPNPVFCLADAPVRDVACLMALHDCGVLPVVDDGGGRKVLGVVTDRDIVVKAVATGLPTETLVARDCMSGPCVTVPIEATAEECCAAMEAHQIRRLVVVDAAGDMVGVLSQADMARLASPEMVGELVQELSLDQRPTF